MSETPSSFLFDSSPAVEDVRPRHGRSVSAFGPTPTDSRGGPGASPTVPAATQAQQRFVNLLRRADVASELRGEEMSRVVKHVESEGPSAARLDLLAAYYAAGDRDRARERRRAMDRWFLYEAGENLDAEAVLTRLLAVAPELHDAQLVRLGGMGGALVLRSGEDVCALEDAPDESGQSSVEVRDLVRGINVLLARKQVRVRLLGLRGDGRREAYLGTPSMTAALTLLADGYLATESPEDLMHLCAW